MEFSDVTVCLFVCLFVCLGHYMFIMHLIKENILLLTVVYTSLNISYIMDTKNLKSITQHYNKVKFLVFKIFLHAHGINSKSLNRF